MKKVSFCLQMKSKYVHDKKKCFEPQHLATNLEYRLKPQRRMTKFLRARIDTCSNVNVMPVSVYHLIYKDPDCAKLVPSQKNRNHTYTTEKIPVIGSCELFVIHPDTKCSQEVTFQVVSTEGSVIVSCATSISLNLIQIHSELSSSLPECRKLIYSCANDPNKKQKCQAQVTVCSGKKGQKTQFKQSNRASNQIQREEPSLYGRRPEESSSNKC